MPLLDTLLDRSIVGGYTRVGYALRSHAPGWTAQDDLPRMDGRVAVVTGATSGIGLAAATGFARLGARTILVARSAERGEQARRTVVERAGAGADAVEVRLADLADLDAVRRLAGELTTAAPQIEVLVNNAGVLTEHRETSAQGHELTFATNVLAPFLLTSLLNPVTRRVVDVSSGGMYTHKLDVGQLQDPEPFDGTKAYAMTKRAAVVLAEAWATRLDPARTVVHAMHPGWVDTPGLAASLPAFHRVTHPLLRPADQGADTIVWLGAAQAPLHSTGRFWQDRRPRPTHYTNRTRETAAQRAALWDACAAATGAA